MAMAMAMGKGKRVELNTGMEMEMEMEMGMGSAMGMVKEEGVLGPMGMGIATVVETVRICSERTFLERTTDTTSTRTV
jgi:hypothetical protein